MLVCNFHAIVMIKIYINKNEKLIIDVNIPYTTEFKISVFLFKN